MIFSNRHILPAGVLMFGQYDGKGEDWRMTDVKIEVGGWRFDLEMGRELDYSGSESSSSVVDSGCG